MNAPFTHEPNEYGFSGDPTTPDVARDVAPDRVREHDIAEDIAVPEDDLVAPITDE